SPGASTARAVREGRIPYKPENSFATSASSRPSGRIGTFAACSDGRSATGKAIPLVETNNFIDLTQNRPRDRSAQQYRTLSATMHLLKRFTRTAPDTIE